jgi:hypothetical protein
VYFSENERKLDLVSKRKGDQKLGDGAEKAYG